MSNPASSPLDFVPATKRLAGGLSLLDALRLECANGSTGTVIAGCGGDFFAFMLDGDGPFSAAGGGATGIDVLPLAARAVEGEYQVFPGWEGGLPPYQAGLSSAMSKLDYGAPSSSGVLYVAAPHSSARAQACMETFARPPRGAQQAA